MLKNIVVKIKADKLYIFVSVGSSSFHCLVSGRLLSKQPMSIRRQRINETGFSLLCNREHILSCDWGSRFSFVSYHESITVANQPLEVFLLRHSIYVYIFLTMRTIKFSQKSHSFEIIMGLTHKVIVIMVYMWCIRCNHMIKSSSKGRLKGCLISPQAKVETQSI